MTMLNSETTTPPLLEVENLKVHFPMGGGLFSKNAQTVYAVDGISLSLNSGETLGIVGESGCGKTTAGLAMLKLIDATEGKIRFNGRDYSDNATANCPALRKEMQLIFQDPYSSLNPRMSVRRIIGDPMEIHGLCNKQDKADKVGALMEKVGLPPEYQNRFPHEFSGGQRQRIGIARALGLNPLLIIGDEPVSALDVSIQAQTINLLMDIQEELGLSMVLISHDLAVVEHLCDRIAVMYLGKIVETGTCEEIYTHPAHPYTRALLSSVPIPDPRKQQERILLKGDVPSPISPPRGCHFHPRCPHASAACRESYPETKAVGTGHLVACHNSPY
ncbi:MAG: ATP-binding cassette domain-containing protein [Desulfobacter sp.]|nr:MAG: ATP-binding cassette domain-containing protein [Desulfobacter sp.]